MVVGIQSAINLGCACFLFPQTVSHKYILSLISVLKLVKSGIGEQTDLLSISPMNLEKWREYQVIQDKVQQGKATFIAMIPMEDFLDKEIVYSRLNGPELLDLKAAVRKLLSGLGTLLFRRY
jgi:Putative ER transporter, 6TM, N-terminal